MANNFSLFIPLTKIDEQKREVYGRATQEILDGHDEIMDYASSVPNFKSWSGTAEKRSKGKSKGNLRSMHQPIASGKLIAIDYNDAEKAIDIGTYISDDQEWKKCLDGTYTGFSIGGDYAKRWSDPSKPGAVRYTAQPHEISLVDAPAVSTATFELIKMDGTTELRKFANVLPIEVEKAEGVDLDKAMEGENIEKVEMQLADGTAIVELEKDHQGAPGIPAEDVEIEEGVTEEAQPATQNVMDEILTGEIATPIGADGTGVPTVENGGKVREIADAPDWVAGFEKTVKQFSDGLGKMEELRKQQAEIDEKVITELKSRGSRVGIARREGEPTTAPSGLPLDWMQYADPANWRWAFSKREDVANTLLAYNKGAGQGRYTPTEWNVVGRRLTRLASEISGDAYQYNPTLKKVERSKQEKTMSGNLNKAIDTAGVLRDLGTQLNAACAMIGNDPSATKDLLMQMLASIDIATDVGSAPKTPDATSGVEEVAKAVVAAVEEVEKVADATAPEVAKAVEVTTPETPAVEKTEVNAEITKMLASQAELIKSMQATLDNITKTQAKQEEMLVPLGDLNTLVANAKADEESPLLKAMNEGNLQKAFEAVGNDSRALYEQVNDLAVRQLHRTGINVSKYGFFPLNADESPS